MKFCLRIALLWGAVLALTCSCSKADKPMPLTKENISAYVKASEVAAKAISPQEYKEARGNAEKQREVIRKALVAPMQKMGYSYDKTIAELIRASMNKTVKPTDAAMASMLNEIGNFAINYREALLKQGVISADTKGLLDQVAPPAEQPSAPADKVSSQRQSTP